MKYKLQLHNPPLGQDRAVAAERERWYVLQ